MRENKISNNKELVRNLELEDSREIKGTNRFKYLGFIIFKKCTTEEELRTVYDRQGTLLIN